MTAKEFFELRWRLQLTQTELAERLRVTRRQVQRWEADAPIAPERAIALRFLAGEMDREKAKAELATLFLPA